MLGLTDICILCIRLFTLGLLEARLELELTMSGPKLLDLELL